MTINLHACATLSLGNATRLTHSHTRSALHHSLRMLLLADEAAAFGA
jgi:hypothetical protein